MKHCWIIGSVKTVTDRIVDLYNSTGGFGTLLWSPTDYGDNGEHTRYTLDMLLNRVLPAVNERVRPLAKVA